MPCFFATGGISKTNVHLGRLLPLGVHNESSALRGAQRVELLELDSFNSTLKFKRATYLLKRVELELTSRLLSPTPTLPLSPLGLSVFSFSSLLFSIVRGRGQLQPSAFKFKVSRLLRSAQDAFPSPSPRSHPNASPWFARRTRYTLWSSLLQRELCAAKPSERVFLVSLATLSDGLNQTIGPVSLATLSGGGLDDAGGAVPWARDHQGHLVDLVQKEVKVLLQSALEVALSVVRANPSVVMETKQVADEFHEVTSWLVHALGCLPFDQLEISDEVKEQVELVHAKLRRAKDRSYSFLEEELLLDLQTTLSDSEDNVEMLKRVAQKLQLTNVNEIKQEFQALQVFWVMDL
ncbi:ATP-dependent zinc metalloprotease [Nymphaea thermarum]|nr:ATP-dependent zinc metalloprotease [Nymphaea thermarum]